MRIDVKKILFVGPTLEKSAFFSKAQGVGLVHFIEPESGKKGVTPKIDKLTHAIKILGGLPVLEQEEMDDYSRATPLMDEIVTLHHDIEKLHESRRVHQLEIARVEVFGDFSMKDLAYIEKEGNRKIQYFFAKKGIFDEVEESLIFIGSDHGLDYFVSINPEARQYDHMVEMQIDQPLGKLQGIQKQINHSIAEREKELKTYAKYNTFLHNALVYQMNSHHLLTAENYAALKLEQALFAVVGWVPENRVDLLEEEMLAMDVHMEEVAIEPEDVVPTCLQNKGAHRIGEDVIRIYDTPSKTDKDPSLWVLGFFALFFAMIMSDAGYGLIYLGIALYLRWKFPTAKGVGKRILNLFTLLSSACVIWGVLVNSFFGIQLAPDSPLRKVSVMQWLVEKRAAYHIQADDVTHSEWVSKYPGLQGVTDPKAFVQGAVKEVNGKPTYPILSQFTDQIMMEIALLVGIIHISLSMLRYLDRNWSGLGWIAFIIGCYLYFPNYLGATTMLHYLFGVDKQTAGVEGIYMIYGGLTLAIVLAVIRDRLFGILELVNVIQIFSDILSYLRLYALGMASAIISGVINHTANSVFLFAGILLVILGHTVNMLLGVMGGVIHGLRLNFLEWYHYCFEGGGKPYTPLEKMEVD